MSRKPIETALVRNVFYARSYSQLKNITASLLLLLLLLVGFYFYFVESTKPMPRYIAATPDGRISISPPLDQNHLLLSQQRVLQNGQIAGMPEPRLYYNQLEQYGENALVLHWVEQVVKDMFDYDFVHYRTVIMRARKYMTAAGHERFLQALTDSRNLVTVKSKQSVVVPSLRGPVRVVNTYLVGGQRFAWDLRVPLRLTYTTSREKDPIVQDLEATLSVARVSTLVNPFYGLAIFRLNFAQDLTTQ